MKIDEKYTHVPSVTAKKGYVMIEDIEAHLHINTIYFWTRKWWPKTLFRRRKFTPKYKEYSVSVFIASGKDIDKKIDKINRRTKR